MKKLLTAALLVLAMFGASFTVSTLSASAAPVTDIQAANDNGNGGGCSGYSRSWPIGGGFIYVETAYCDGSGNLVIVSAIVRQDASRSFLQNINPANDEGGGGGCNPYPVKSCWAIPIGNGQIVYDCNTWWVWPC